MNESDDLREQFATSITLGGLVLRRENLLKRIESGDCDPEDGLKRVRAVEAAILCLDPDAEAAAFKEAFSADDVVNPALLPMLVRYLQSAEKPLSPLQLAVAIGKEHGISLSDLGAVRSLAENIETCLDQALAEGRLVKMRGSRHWAWMKPRTAP